MSWLFLIDIQGANNENTLYNICTGRIFSFAQDIGSLSPIFYMFVDREKLFGIVEAGCEIFYFARYV
jgi:NADH:ubiquinone oxidoreductase subunit D